MVGVVLTQSVLELLDMVREELEHHAVVVVGGQHFLAVVPLIQLRLHLMQLYLQIHCRFTFGCQPFFKFCHVLALVGYLPE